MDHPLEHHDVQTNGVRLHVVQCGPLDGPLVVLLHGFPEYWDSWRAQMPALAAAGYRVWVPDQRGYNLSDKPTRLADYTLPVLAADVLGLLDAAGRAQASLIGHDWGGLVAWYLAAHHADRLARVSILNAPRPAGLPRQLWQVPDQLLRSWYMLFFQLPGVPEWLFRRRNWRFGATMLRRTSRPGTFAEAEIARYKAAWAQPGAITSMLNWYRALRLPAKARWPRIELPLLLIWGKRDAFLNARLAKLSLRHCTQGRLYYFPQATHWVQLEEATKVNDLLVRFLQKDAPATVST